MTLMWKEIFEQPEVLQKCLHNNNAVIEKLVKAIRDRNINSVVIAARGTSDHAGIYGKYIIEYLSGIPVALAAPSILTIYKRSLNLKNSLVIGISQSGKAADVMEVIKEANNQGSITVGITNFNSSPLAEECKFNLFTDAGIEGSVAATKTFTSQMLLLALLASAWIGEREFAEALQTVPGKAAETLKAAEEIKEKIQRYRFMEECFVLSRGINYPIALESALKIQETTYVKAKAYATSDFYHGPFAMIEKNTPVLVYASEGPCLNDIKEMILKLKSSEAELLVISNNKEIAALGNCSLVIPYTNNDLISPFYNVIIAQMFACQLALTKGLNPDCPRGLKKVTITK